MEAERSSQRPSKPTKLNLNTNPGIVRDKDAIKYWKISQTNKQNHLETWISKRDSKGII